MTVTQSELERYLWGAATVLRGTIDAGDYKQFIFPLLFFKRMSDVWDEEYQQALDESSGDLAYAAFAENHRFQLPDGTHWDDIRSVATGVGQALQAAMRAIEQANPDRLYGIFGDAQWTNKDRLSDETLRDLTEHFSTKSLSTRNVPEDQFGQAYEYLIKRFADDSGHTAQEFYTNRTLVHLMTLILDPQPGESVYDPTCGTGGMLLSAAAELRSQGKEYRNLKLFGQELNLMTASIARMNLFLHGIVDFDIERGNTLSDPKFLQGDGLRHFDAVLANPPYSIKQWNRDAWVADPYGRNRFGTPPQGRADYAFFQHILASMAPQHGRCAVLLPHGVLFRDEERGMRRRIVDADLIDCVLGLGPGLFYNSPMEACVIFARAQRSNSRKGKMLFINAVDAYSRDGGQSFLSSQHVDLIARAYEGWTDVAGLARVVSQEEIASRDHNLNISLYVDPSRATNAAGASDIAWPTALESWLRGSEDVRQHADEALAEISGRAR
jgi:type I restriction enzyme M protein